jgi:hypothetical protein
LRIPPASAGSPQRYAIVSDVENPVLVIVEWLASQAPEIRDDLCLRLLMFGGQGLPESADDIAGPVLQQLRDAPRDLGDVGRAFQLRSILDFEIGKKAMPWDWSGHRWLLNKPDASPSMKTNMEQSIREGPLREKRWQQAHQDWLRLRKAVLTDERIDAFVRDFFSGRNRPGGIPL